MKKNWNIYPLIFLFGLCFSAAGCAQNTAPAMTDPPASERGFTPVEQEITTPGPVLDDDPPHVNPPVDPPTLLETAVHALQAADSFQMTAHEVVAYRVDPVEGESRSVYGEFITTYEVRSSPRINIHARHEYRYEPEARFDKQQTLLFEQDGAYYQQIIENGDRFEPEEIAREEVEPFAGVVFQTLTAYYPEAQYLYQDEAAAVYVLRHSQWYTLERGIGFADLGMLVLQEDWDSLIKQYVSDHYPEVAPIQFLIYVSRDTGYITKVVVLDRAFMESVWEAVNQALRESGGTAARLSAYQMLEDHQMEYVFYYSQAPSPFSDSE